MDDPVGGNQIITKWTVVPDRQAAIAAGCRWVMLTAKITGSELPLTSFRQLGFTLGLEHNDSPGASAVVAADITDYGLLQNIEYKQVVNRDSANIYNSIVIFEF
jgi:hypothetical protein